MAVFEQRQVGPMSPVTHNGGQPPQSVAPTNAAVLYNGSPVRQDWGVQAGPPAAHFVPRHGYGVAQGSAQPVYHGMPVDLALARLINQENAADQQAYQASMAGARNTQLMQAQNNPETYRIAQEYIKSGMPAHKAQQLALTNVMAANGDYLGLGASLPASQQAIDEFSGTNAQLGALFGISSPEVSSGGAFNIKAGNPVRGFTVNPDGTADVYTSNGTVTGVKGSNLGTAVGFGTQGPLAKPLQMTSVTAQQLGNGTSPIYKKQASTEFNDRAVAKDALDYIHKFDKKAEDEKKKSNGLNTGVGNLYGVGE